MSDREMLAYAIILVGGLIYAAAIARWWYMAPVRMFPRREREARARYKANRAAKLDANPLDPGGAHDR